MPHWIQKWKNRIGYRTSLRAIDAQSLIVNSQCFKDLSFADPFAPWMPITAVNGFPREIDSESICI